MYDRKRGPGQGCGEKCSNQVRVCLRVQVFQRMEQAGLLADMDGLALVTRRVLYALPTLVAGPLMTTAHLAVDSGRAARRWINRPPPAAAK